MVFEYQLPFLRLLPLLLLLLLTVVGVLLAVDCSGPVLFDGHGGCIQVVVHKECYDYAQKDP
jgi:hypothetical protein